MIYVALLGFYFSLKLLGSIKTQWFQVIMHIFSSFGKIGDPGNIGLLFQKDQLGRTTTVPVKYCLCFLVTMCHHFSLFIPWAAPFKVTLLPLCMFTFLCPVLNKLKSNSWELCSIPDFRGHVVWHQLSVGPPLLFLLALPVPLLLPIITATQVPSLLIQDGTFRLCR